jgi:Ni/Fe-hydrogenase subunit HybB-like protein
MSEESYTREAAVRIAYFSAAAAAACVITAIITGAAVLVANAAWPDRDAGAAVSWIAVATFATSCGVLVYYADRELSKRFNKNPQ